MTYSDCLKPAALLLTAALAACGGERQNDEAALTEGSLDKAVQEIAEQTILTAVNDFANEAEALNSAADTFCAAVSDSNLSALQTQWQTTSAAWYRLLPFNFGPLDDDLVFPAYQYIDSYRLRGDDYTSTIRTAIADWLASADSLDDDFFSALTFNKVGLPAIEIAAFETSATHSTATADIVAEYNSESRKCAVLSGLTTQLQSRADYVEDGWQVAYTGTSTPFISIFNDGELPDGSESLTGLITAVQEYLDYLQNRDVVSNVAPLAGNSWALVSESIDQIERMLAGNEETVVTIFSLMAASGNSGNVDTVEENIQMARDAVADQDATTFNAAAALLDGNFKREIPDSLDVTLGINFSDGD